MKTIKQAQKLDATEQAVADLLHNAGIKYFARLVEENHKKDNWVCDKWYITMEKDKTTESFDYHTGTGHRAISDIDKRRVTAMNSKPRRSDFERFAQPVPPKAASVFYGLLQDAQWGQETFDDFCDNLGYDTDSRKALATYLACQTIDKQLRKLLTRDQRAELEELLQDY